MQFKAKERYKLLEFLILTSFFISFIIWLASLANRELYNEIYIFFKTFYYIEINHDSLLIVLFLYMCLIWFVFYGIMYVIMAEEGVEIG